MGSHRYITEIKLLFIQIIVAVRVTKKSGKCYIDAHEKTCKNDPKGHSILKIEEWKCTN